MRVHRDVGNADCDECVLQRDEFKPHGVLVQIGSGDETAMVCVRCLRRAIALVNNQFVYDMALGVLYASGLLWAVAGVADVSGAGVVLALFGVTNILCAAYLGRRA